MRRPLSAVICHFHFLYYVLVGTWTEMAKKVIAM